MRRREELSNLYVTSNGHLARFEYLHFEMDEPTFLERVTHQEDFTEDEQIFEIDINCLWVPDFIETHPLFPLIVWSEEDIVFGFNPRFIDKVLGW